MQFQHQYPEVQDMQMSSQGVPIVGGVALPNLRLHQLRNMARAWRIKIDMDAPKPRILPVLMEAAQQGTFRLPPSLPYYWLRAQFNGDERGHIPHPPFEYPDGMPVKPVADDALPSDLQANKKDDPFAKMYVQWTYAELKTEVKRLDPSINLYGISRAACGRFLYEHGIQPTSKPLKAEHFPEEAHADHP